MKDTTISLADRMKNLENISRFYLGPKQPIVLRIDGKTFSKYTRQSFIKKPFSDIIDSVFKQTTLQVCKDVQGAELAYHQSDEVSFFLKDYNSIKQEQYLGGNIQKISSVITSMFTYHFNKFMQERILKDGIDEILRPAFFDCRTFSLPQYEVNNYFIWRQRDAIRNSVTQYASSFFSDKQLHQKNTDEKLAMIVNDGHPAWDTIPLSYQRGTAFRRVEVELSLAEMSGDEINYLVNSGRPIPETITRMKWAVDTKTPLFSDDINYINDLVYSTEEEVK